MLIVNRQRWGENNEGLSQCNIEEGSVIWKGGTDKLLSLLPFVSVKGCDSLTFAGSNPASSFFTHYARVNKIQADTCLLRERLNNK